MSEKQIEKTPAAVVRHFREEMNLSVKQICRILKTGEATWKLWESKDAAPYFLSFALKYLRERASTRNTAPKQNSEGRGAGIKRAKNLSDRQRFLLKTEFVRETGCRLWRGGNSLRFGNDFDSPRQAAWRIAHGEKTENDLKVTCGSEKCVEITHLEESAKSKGTGRRFISEDLKNLVRFELQKDNANQKEIARRLKISTGTVSRIASAQNKSGKLKNDNKQ